MAGLTRDYEGMGLEELEQERRNLLSTLTSVASDIGDWKIAKCMEYQAAGMELPYDLDKLHEDRQAARDEIAAIDEAISKAAAAAGSLEEA